ncbi:MAG: hypothetical protein ACKO58_04940, partial [Cyanobium sp.]
PAGLLKGLRLFFPETRQTVCGAGRATRISGCCGESIPAAAAFATFPFGAFRLLAPFLFGLPGHGLLGSLLVYGTD